MIELELIKDAIFESDDFFDIYGAMQVLVKRMTLYARQLRLKLEGEFASMVKKLQQRLQGLKRMLSDTFTVDSAEDYSRVAVLCSKELAEQLYRVQQMLSSFRSAVVYAAGPIVQVLVPVVQLAVQALTNLALCIGRVLRALFFGSTGADTFTTALQGTAAAGTALRRTLAGFDQLTRVGAASSGGGGWITDTDLPALSGAWEKLAQKLEKLLKPLRELDFSKATESFNKLKQAIEPIKKTLFEGLEWAWNNLLIPLAQWTAEELLPVFLDTLTVALQTLSQIIEEIKPTLNWLWEECLQPLAHWAGDQVIDYFKGLQQELYGMSDWVSTNQGPIAEIVHSIKSFVAGVSGVTGATLQWNLSTEQMGGTLNNLIRILAGVDSPLGKLLGSFQGITDTLFGVKNAFSLVDSASLGTWNGLKNVWSNAWSWLKDHTADPMAKGLKDVINAFIAMLNGAMQGGATAINALASGMNSIKFSIPSWIPVLGGKSFSLGLKTVTPPQIPLLAKGAVLPANKPFMAVVGDQKHGTNVEAPLSVIQEAMAQTMADYTAGNMAGHQATVSVLQQLLQAVLGIHLTDEDVAAAVNRHNGKMAVMTGGYL